MYRRKMPHWHPPGVAVSVTWRLAGSLPNLSIPVAQASACDLHGRAFVERDRLLDHAKTGPDWLRRPQVAWIFVNEIQRGNRAQYELRAFVVMPNHVHVLLTPWTELADITRAIKGRSARQANAALSRTGLPFWQDESFDHWMRDAAQFEKVRAYIHNNPVRAGLVRLPEEWLFSSASQAEACAT